MDAISYDYTIESFIGFCDDMIIAEEGTIGYYAKQIWNVIITAFQKIAAFFKNIALHINMLKEAKVSKQMNSDLQKVLENLTPKNKCMVLGYDFWNAMFKILKRSAVNERTEVIGGRDILHGNGRLYEVYFNDLGPDFFKAHVDVTETKRVVFNSSEYKRIEANNYNDEKETIIMTPIIKECSTANSLVAKYTGHLRTVGNLTSSIKHTTAVNEILAHAAGICRGVISIYNEKIKLLHKYISIAKFSLTGTKNNLKALINRNPNVFTRDHNGSFGVEAFKKRFSSSSDYTNAKEITEKFFSSFRRIGDNEWDIVSFDEYTKRRNDLIKVLGCPDGTIYNLYLETYSDDTLTISVGTIPEKAQTINLLKDTRLFHTSPEPDIKELYARFSNGRVYWKTPRVYFSLQVPIARDGSVAKGTNCYELISVPPQAKIDKELGGYAVFIETTKDLPVKKFVYEDWEDKIKETL